jgi:hypothetical protein
MKLHRPLLTLATLPEHDRGDAPDFTAVSTNQR